MDQDGEIYPLLRSMRGRTVVLTGGTGGIGRVVAERLGFAGARVILAVRDLDRGRRIASTIPGAQLRMLDLADLASVRRFARDWSEPIAVLINNAGIMMVPEAMTADGFELQFGVNHLGHYALTNLLLPHLTDRVVTVGSKAQMFGRINLQDPHWRRRRYRPMGAYAQSKLANLLFTAELQRRLGGRSGLRAVAADPGFAATDLARHTERPVLDRLMGLGIRLGAQAAADGALPILLAAAGDLAPAGCTHPAGRLGMRGRPVVGELPRRAHDPGLGRRLWELSARETGIDLASGVRSRAVHQR